ncbi:OmpA family protein [Oceanobacter mangrovi]|uniref:OmpA family protein n=1 Tax=Oceanobacter mangrovi TaxID=2862510 RepID=UPI001C8ECC3A|nr:OmpA family protein [Oceanobacter mangrovi]
MLASLAGCGSTKHIGMWVEGDGRAPDYDSDGVPDNIDLCEVEMPGVPVDENGCPWDDDRDGVANIIDRCPETYPPAVVDQWGCIIDGDADGVLDVVDDCPDTPPDTLVDFAGCTLDSDGDSIADSDDLCPNTPDGLAVGGDGCANSVAGLPVLQAVHFEFNRDVLKPTADAVLDQVANYMSANPEVRILIVGHTDSLGTDVYNLELSWRRARSAYQYLLGVGVSPDRLLLAGKGEFSPIDSNDSKEGQARNRRVEFLVVE